MPDKQDVNIYICGRLEGEEEIVTETRGTMQKVNGKIHIFYNEHFEGDTEETQNHIILTPSQVRLMRRGAVEINMIFETGLTHNTVYHTQAGMLAVGIVTDAMEVRILDSGVDLDIRYSLEFEGMEPVNNHLKLTAST